MLTGHQLAMAAHRRAIEMVSHRGQAGEHLFHGLAKGLQAPAHEVKSDHGHGYIYMHAGHNMQPV